VGGIVAGVVLVVAVVFFSAISCGLVFKGPLRTVRSEQSGSKSDANKDGTENVVP
jgi:hypothetical protein